ncbi:MAG: exopolysaccharide biosynthesis polyprenyl glycosylphosphotransferase [Lachnospiraceae bacterium]|nr:exopolysaccharide biosynthesis polyprenyl glycosylphosphotransferase [Lachnospiraceae bacterium]
MYAYEQKKRLLGLGANFIILLFEILSFSYVWFKYYRSTTYHNGDAIVIGMYTLFMFLITKSLNGYKNSYMRSMDLCLSHMLAVIFAAIVGHIFICMVWSDYVDVLPVVIMAVVQIVFDVLWVILVRRIYVHIYPPRRVILIYGNYPLETFLKKLDARQDRYEVCEILNYQKGFERICSDVLDFEGVFLYDLPAEERNEIVKYCYEHSIRTYIVPKITDIIMKCSDDLYLVDTPIYLSRNYGLNIDDRILKRLTDIIVSFAALVVLSPIMLIIAIAIKLYDGGNVFYKQLRLTKDGKMFMIYKFRSMINDENDKGKNARLASRTDTRITPVGKIIRNLHLDELPQLFNVLKGEMSLVGPRPERPEIFLKYEKSVPQFDFRLKVKAGLTGYAQVYGKYNTSPIDKLKMDLTYIQQYTYWLDIKLMLLTLKIMFRKESSEGVDDKKLTALPSDYKVKTYTKKYDLSNKKGNKI